MFMSTAAVDLGRDIFSNSVLQLCNNVFVLHN